MQNSLWLALGGRLGGMGLGGGFNDYGLSPVDEVLQRDEYTLEDLLDVEKVIQEAKYCNSQLLDYLSTHSVVEQLVRHTIAEPPVDEPSAELAVAEPPRPAASNESTDAVSSAADAAASTAAAESAADPVEPAPIPVAAPALTSSPSSPHGSLLTASIDENSTAIGIHDSLNSSVDSDDDGPPELRDEEEEQPKVHRNRHKFPYVASELLCCEVGSIVDILVEDDALLTLLFSLLDRPPPLDPSSVSYFRKVLQVLIQRKYVELVSFCARSGVLDKLLQHLGLYSVMELIIMLGWDSGWDTSSLDGAIDQSWMLNQGLIPHLVRKLHPRFSRLPDVHAHAGRLLVDVVVKCPMSVTSPLVAHLQTTPVLEALFSTHMFSGCTSSLSNSLSVIIVLVQRYANRRVEQLDADAHAAIDGVELTADAIAIANERAAPPFIAPTHEHDFAIASGAVVGAIDDLEPAYDADLHPAPEFAEVDASIALEPELVELGEPFISLLPHLGRILDLLRPDEITQALADPTTAPATTTPTPPSSPPSIHAPMMVPGVLGSPAFGSLRMKVVELCLVLARSRSPLIDYLLSSFGVSRIMLSVFFLYPWSNLLHGLVESIITSSLEEPDAQLTRSFFRDGLLVEAFIAGWERNEEVVRGGGMRLGYMGHLVRTAATVNHMLHANMTDLQREALLHDSADRWTWFVNDVLAVELARQQSDEPLDALMGDELTDLGLHAGLTSAPSHSDLAHSADDTAADDHSSAHHYLDDDDDDDSEEDHMYEEEEEEDAAAAEDGRRLAAIPLQDPPAPSAGATFGADYLRSYASPQAVEHFRQYAEKFAAPQGSTEE